MTVEVISYDNLQSKQALTTLNRDGVFKLTGSPAVVKAVNTQFSLLNENGYFSKAGAKWSDLCDFNGGERLHFPMLEVFTDSKVADLCAAYLGSELCMSSTAVSASIRTIDPTARVNGGVPFHQDRAVIGVERSLTFWYLVAPDRTTETVPGLDLVTGHRKNLARHDVVKMDETPRHAMSSEPGLTTPAKSEYYDLKIPEGAPDGPTFHTPRIERGEVIVFDNYCPHRTSVGASYTEERTSLDVRIWRFDTRTAASLIRAGHGLVVMMRQDWLQPARKHARMDFGSVFEHTPAPEHPGSNAFNRRVVTRAFARAQLEAHGILTGKEQDQSSTDLMFEQFIEICAARFELALEDGRNVSFISEAATSCGRTIEQTYHGDGGDPTESLEASGIVPLLPRAKAAGARFFGSLFIGRPATALCEMVFYDLHRGQEHRAAGTVIRDRFGNFLCIDGKSKAA